MYLLQFRLSEEVFEEFNRNPIDLGRQNAILRDYAENLPVLTFTNTNGNNSFSYRYSDTRIDYIINRSMYDFGTLEHFFSDIRFCDKCRIVKPDRSHHCSVCRKCVLKMDHHCPWVNNCVSYSNYKYFILFLAYGLLMCIYVVATTAEYVIKFWDVTSDMVIHILFKYF